MSAVHGPKGDSDDGVFGIPNSSPVPRALAVAAACQATGCFMLRPVSG